jgi:hypothetical protein
MASAGIHSELLHPLIDCFGGSVVSLFERCTNGRLAHVVLFLQCLGFLKARRSELLKFPVRDCTMARALNRLTAAKASLNFVNQP